MSYTYYRNDYLTDSTRHCYYRRCGNGDTIFYYESETSSWRPSFWLTTQVLAITTSVKKVTEDEVNSWLMLKELNK